MGGGPGHFAGRGHTRRRGHGEGAGRGLRRPAAAAARPRPAKSAGQARRPVRRGENHGPGRTLAHRAAALRAAGRHLRLRPEEEQVTYALIRASRLDLDAFPRDTGTHPDLIRRLVALGLIDARQDPAGELWFAPGQAAALARVKRLRAGLALNYAAVGLVVELLDRIRVLEAAQRTNQAAQRSNRRPGA